MSELKTEVQKLGLGDEAEEKLQKFVEEALIAAQKQIDGLPFYLRFFASTILDIVKSALKDALKNLE